MAWEVGRSEIITGCVRIVLRKAEIRNEGISEGRDKWQRYVKRETVKVEKHLLFSDNCSCGYLEILTRIGFKV